MIQLSTLAATVLLLGGSPAANDAPMADFFKGTLEIDVPAGGPWSAKSYLSPDHTFRSISTDGPSHGTWEVRDGKLCTTTDQPPPGPDRLKTYCNLGVGKKLGEMWRDTDPVTGNTVLFRLAPERD
jgi:hypothetical protein